MSGGGTATESATIPEDISGQMLELDEDEDLEVFSKVNKLIITLKSGQTSEKPKCAERKTASS